MRNDLNALKANYRDMQAQIKQAQDDIDYYDREFHRQQDLAAKNIASQQTFDTARRNLQNAQQKLASLNEQLAAIAANLNGDPDIAVEQHPRYLDAMAQRDEAARQLDHTVVKAPFAGIVTNVPALAPGKYLQASMTAFYLVAIRPRLGRRQPEGDRAHECAPRPAGHGDGGHLPGRGMARHRREHQPGGGAGVLAAAGAEHQRQLGEGGAAHPDARAPRHQRQDRCRRCAAGMSVEVNVDTGHARGLPRFLTALVRPCPAGDVMSAAPAADAGNRTAITVCVILATLMQSLDTTIANIALPYIQGSVSASQDQINWVLTSYIVAAAIMTPPTGFLAGRFGRKRLFLVAVAGFTLASMLCGMAQSLPQIVLFRILQGMFGAALVPLSQSVLIDIYPPERRGSAMALFGVAVMVGPILGPVLGGWLTENYTWRWVFYINLPIGALALLGIITFLPDTERNAGAKLDWFGFGTLSLAIGALQVMLDRGEQLDWFGSAEIWIEAIVAASAFYLFVVHTFTADAPVRAAGAVPRPQLRSRDAVHRRRRRQLSGIAGVADALSAEPDELPDRHRRPGDGTARHRHDGRHDGGRPPDRAGRHPHPARVRPRAHRLGALRR